MAERSQSPDADRQEQLEPAAEQETSDPLANIVVNVEAPEADVLEQHTPAGPQPELAQMPRGSRVPPAHIPEADALEGAMPADHELFEEGE
ncbi:MAG: hypothetical protein ACHQ7M_18500 [Chloroflexota bacterium]